MAARLSNSTMAAGLTPVLRESVNAVRGPDNAPASASDRNAAKGGNATTVAKEKATTGKPGGNEAASDDRLDTHHSGTLSSTFPLDRCL